MALDKNFFYDRQLSNRATSIRLYSEDTLIGRAILSGPVGYTVNNSWGESTGVLGTLLDMGIGFLEGLKGQNAQLASETLDNLSWLPLVGDYAKKGADFIDKYNNAHFYNAANRIKAFNGSTVSLKGADSVTFELISDTTETNIIEQVDTLVSYAIGEDLSTGLGIDSTWLGIQGSPNNYSWRSDAIDLNKRHIPQTLTMFVGNLLVIDNLLVERLDVTFSTQCVMTKGNSQYPNTSKVKGATAQKYVLGKPTNIPLYATVEMGFTYARMLMARDLANVMIRTAGSDSFYNEETGNKRNADTSGVVNTQAKVNYGS